MKRLFFLIPVIALIAIAAFIIYVKNALPNVGDAPDLNISVTPERVARGEYLANHVMVCADCHSLRDFSLYTAPIKKGTFYIGGSNEFTEKYGAPGNYYPPNLTPFYLKEWTDGEIYRAITAGVSKDGHALFPIMPYPLYSQASDEDIYSVIAYLRTLPSMESEVPKSEPKFPINILINTMPKKGVPTEETDKSNKVEYGKYLTTVAGCIDCHTPMEKGKLVMDEAFTGGREFIIPNGIIQTSNLTPDAGTGIGTWTEEYFLNRFRVFRDSAYVPLKVSNGPNTNMPWTMYAHMEEEDLKAIYAYLRTLKPYSREVVKFVPAN